MHVQTLFRRTIQLAFACLVLVAPVFAQAPLEPAQMPQRTVFYLLWRGTPAPSVRAANSLLSLWDDPDFAPVRSALVENLLSDSKKSANPKPGPTREEIAQYASLLENPFVLGYLPESRGAAPATDAAKKKWNGIFFVYDRTGKEALLSKAVLQLRASEKDIPKVSETTLAGIPVLKVERTSGVTYWAEHGKYAISANEPEVFEQIASILGGKALSGNSLAETPAYREAEPLLHGGILEFFLRVPRQSEIASAAGPANNKKVEPVLDALKLDSVHSIFGQVTLEGSRTRLTGAVLGEPAPGTLFDLIGDGQAAPASLAFVPADAVSYQESEFSLVSLYTTAKRAFLASQPPEQQGGAAFIEAMAQAKLGMPLPDALALLTGEFASLQTVPASDDSKRTIFVGIHDKAATLKLLHFVLKDQILSEHERGEASYLTISLTAKQPGGSGVPPKLYHLAVTPSLVLAGSSSQALEEELSRRASSANALPSAFRTVRAQFPEKLTGISYLDFQKLDWDAIKEKLLESSSKSVSKSFAQEKSAPVPAIPSSMWLMHVDPKVFPRHLHVSTSASWKDAKGIHFDGWIE